MRRSTPPSRPTHATSTTARAAKATATRTWTRTAQQQVAPAPDDVVVARVRPGRRHHDAGRQHDGGGAGRPRRPAGRGGGPSAARRPRASRGPPARGRPPVAGRPWTAGSASPRPAGAAPTATVIAPSGIWADRGRGTAARPGGAARRGAGQPARDDPGQHRDDPDEARERGGCCTRSARARRSTETTPRRRAASPGSRGPEAVSRTTRAARDDHPHQRERHQREHGRTPEGVRTAAAAGRSARIAARVDPAARRCQDPPMPAPDDPGRRDRARTSAAPPPHRHDPRGSRSRWSRSAWRSPSGCRANDDPGRLAVDRGRAARAGARRGPAADASRTRRAPGFSALAAAAGWAARGLAAATARGPHGGDGVLGAGGPADRPHGRLAGTPSAAPADARRTGRRGMLLRSFDVGRAHRGDLDTRTATRR